LFEILPWFVVCFAGSGIRAFSGEAYL